MTTTVALEQRSDSKSTDTARAQGRHRDSQLRADAGVPRGGLLQAGLDSGEVKNKQVAEVAKEISENEQEHVQALKATVEQLGGKPAAKPKTKFDDVLAGGEKKILETAASVENLGAAAYLGQAGNIQSKEILAAALSIHSVEGRHAAVLNQAHRQVDRAGRRVRQAGRHGKSPEGRQALHQGLTGRLRKENRCLSNMTPPELAAIEVKGMTREAFIVRGTIAAGSVYGLSTVAPFVRQAIAQGAAGSRHPELRPHSGVPRGRVLHDGR